MTPDKQDAATEGGRSGSADASLPPLCVDLDGTLVRTDTLVEGILGAVKRDFRNVFALIGALFRGRAAFKAAVAQRAELAMDLLPVHEELWRWLGEQHAAGRRLVLCTAANWRVAESAARHFGIFSETLASSEEINLKGRIKAQKLREMFGDRGYDYAGNDTPDIAVWQGARHAIVVAPTRRLQARMKSVERVERVFAAPGSPLRAWLRAIRPHQWTKNLLVFAPAIAAHQLLEPGILLKALAAFVLFSMCASGVYLLNDLLDLESDRRHPSKRNRPFASGSLQPFSGLLVAAALIAGALLLSLFGLGALFALGLLGYVIATSMYSIFIKRIPMVDALTLAGLYTSRVMVGGLAIGILPSFWLLAFSLFIFLSIAMAKRYAELLQVRGRGAVEASGRGYTTEDLALLQSCGVSAGYISVLVLALYIQAAPGELYRHPEVIWLICPVVLYWIARIWLKTHRGQMHEDPVVFALRDRPSLFVACVTGLLFFAAI